jgi:mono/diheme cytochrome c family protein
MTGSGFSARSARLAAALCAVTSLPALAAPAGQPGTPTTERARPLIKKYCAACHGPSKTKGGLRFDRLDFDLGRGKDGERWHEVAEQLRQGEMPPEGKPQPAAGERRALLDWLEAGLAEASRRKQAEAASVLRRLTREQYTNTLRDLLGVDSDYTRLLPPESPSRMGMQNDGRVLASSTLHLEQTMRIARTALDRALSIGAPPPAWRFRFVFGKQPGQAPQATKKVDLGYQAQPLDAEQWKVETFIDPGPVKTATLSPKGELRERCYVDLRGSTDYDHKGSKPRYSVDQRGLLLMPAKPHIEREAQIWQGPNPNLDLILRDFPAEGPFVLRVTVERASATGPAPWLRAFAGNRLDDGIEYATFDEPRRVDAPPGKPQVIELHGRLENLPLPVVDPNDREFLSNMMVVGVWNDVLVTDAAVTSPALVIKSIEFEGPVTPAWPSATHRRIFFDDRLRAEPEAYARQILERFLTRAFRRPVTEAQLGRYMAFWRRQFQAKDGGSFEEAMRDTLAAALSSPSFLHHVEIAGPARASLPEREASGPAGRLLLASTAAPRTAAPRATAELGGRIPLDDHALANRLSFLLWNSMPDEVLQSAADAGALRAQLPAQVTRMLRDARARDFIRGYTAQWLDLGALDRVKIDVKQSPAFTRFVKEDLLSETSRYVERLLLENRPLTELIDSDTVVVNQNLARFYGLGELPGLDGPAWIAAKLPPSARSLRGGGLLTQGSFLAGHSTGEDSHPIKRGVWLSKKLLDSPPPPPPPNVPEIDRENPEIARLPVKAQLELHRNKESCRGCHSKLDPWGIPFEQFGADGVTRTSITKNVHGKPFTSPVDAATELPDGRRVNGLAELRAYLVEEKRDQLRRSAARHLAAYALGRTPGFVDDQAVQGICATAKARGDGMRDLLLAVIASLAFQSK